MSGDSGGERPAGPGIDDAQRRLDDVAGPPLLDLVDDAELAATHANKGAAGTAIERLLGGAGGPGLLDFADGELKTYAADIDGFPLQTVAVSRVGDVDALLDVPHYATTRAYKKLRRVFFVGVYRPSPAPASWVISNAFRFDARPGTDWYERLSRDFERIARGLRAHLLTGATFTTITAPLLQFRVRDAKPYTPVFSQRLGREVSNKALGLYLTTAMLTECVEEARACR